MSMRNNIVGVIALSFLINGAVYADVAYGPADKKPGVATKVVKVTSGGQPQAQGPNVVYESNGKAVPDVYSSDMVAGMGSDVPLDQALKSLVPGNFGITYSGFDPATLKVSWRGGRPWYEILREIEQTAALDMDIRTNPDHILIARAGSAVVSSDPGFLSLPTAPNCSGVANKDLGSPLVKQVTAFSYKKGLSLKQVLEEWARPSCWAVSYELDTSYPMVNNHTLYGSFEEVTLRLLSKYQDAEPALQFSYYNEDRILVVQPKQVQNDY